jgi:hypothetical protein
VNFRFRGLREREAETREAEGLSGVDVGSGGGGAPSAMVKAETWSSRE